MKRTIHCILLLIALILSGPILASAGADKGEAAPQKAMPNIMIPEPLFTFDAVVDGTEVVHDFRIYNRGKGDLAISRVQTG